VTEKEHLFRQQQATVQSVIQFAQRTIDQSISIFNEVEANPSSISIDFVDVAKRGSNLGHLSSRVHH
jgi:hypothetical protein